MGNNSKSEQRFQEAFIRLKKNAPSLLPKGSPVTQNNVAREAGRTQTALRADRFPALCAEIERWVKAHPLSSPKQPTGARRQGQSRSDKKLISDLKAQRDKAQSRLLAAEQRIMELQNEVVSLESQLPDEHANVTTLRPGQNA